MQISATASSSPSSILPTARVPISTATNADSEDYKISVITWNLAEKSPTKKDYSFLQKYRSDDIVVIGAQECEDVRPRRQEGVWCGAAKLI